ncbi:MAG: hypothetical protein CMP33_01680 [Rickettsiales bacterium]|nr:hypothetical protein [Rickettsiales bacterium]
MFLKHHYILFLIFSIVLVSCVGEKLVPIKGPESEDGSQLNFAQFDDIPIPVGSTLDQQNSIIISKRQSWLGRLTFESTKKQLEIFDFFRNELPKFGWKKLSEVQADSSLLNYVNESRIASIIIESKTLFGSIVKITVTETEIQ